MATVTRNPATGEYPLADSNAIVSVPPQCAGAHRCPLFVFIPSGNSAREAARWFRPAADKYGLILLTLTSWWAGDYEPPVIDAAIRETLRRFAIDPAKIAISGRCATGQAGIQFGLDNPDVFSRVVGVSGGLPRRVDPANTTTEFLIDVGLWEGGSPVAAGAYLFQAADSLRRGGHPVTVSITLRGHEHQVEDYDFVVHWLQQSWAWPDPARRPVSATVAEPLPRLTPTVLAQMTVFWTRFAKEPDSIRVAARRAHLREVSVPVWTERATTWMTDMAALAARYPSVAADLKAAGLTARQHDAYRVALISALVSSEPSNRQAFGSSAAASVLAQNVVFTEAHPDEFRALREAGITNPAALQKVADAVPGDPKMAEAVGPMGIWRTP